MSCYKNDNAEFINQAINSIIHQTVQPNEIIIVVDGVVGDEIDSVLRSFEDKFDFIKVFRQEKNVGLGLALQFGLTKCSFGLIARMDSDDIAVSDRFEKQLKMFEMDSQLDIVSGDIYEFIESPEDIVSKRCLPSQNQDIKEYMKTRCAINHMAVMMKKQAVLSAGNYQDWHYNEDYYLWIRMLINGAKFANIAENLVFVRVGKDMFKRRGGKKYYKSEKKLQKFMLDNGVIDKKTFLLNVLKRYVVQVLMPNNLRSWVFKKFARN